MDHWLSGLPGPDPPPQCSYSDTCVDPLHRSSGPLLSTPNSAGAVPDNAFVTHELRAKPQTCQSALLAPAPSALSVTARLLGLVCVQEAVPALRWSATLDCSCRLFRYIHAAFTCSRKNGSLTVSCLGASGWSAQSIYSIGPRKWQ